MLKIEISIHEDGKSAETQARAVVASLVSLYGLGVIPASYERVGEIERATGPVVINRIEASPLASDGHPTLPPVPQEDEPEVVLPGGLDTAGTPWDERIHASTKTTNKDGTWTRRRNTPDATFDAVMAELKATPAPAVVPAPPAAEPTAAEAFTPPASVTIPATVPAPPSAQAQATEVAAQAAIAAAQVPGFVDIMKKVTTLQSAGKLPKAQLDEYLGSVGVEGIGKMATASADIRSAFGAILDGIA